MENPVLEVAPVPNRLAELRSLVSELMALKRVRTPDLPDGLAAHGFRRAWAALVSGEAPATLALRETALALSAVRLGGMDFDALRRAGLSLEQTLEVLRRGFEAATAPVDAGLREQLRTALAGASTWVGAEPPAFVERLVRQPRAGPTRANKQRVVLLPAESHADHCYVVAVASVLVSPLFEADPTGPFVAALSHHVFNAVLPDAGSHGNRLLGEHLAPLMARLTEQVLDTLPSELAHRVREARRILPHTDTPEARAFHAADTLDRVLEDPEFIHDGPMRAYENAVLAAAGLSH
ncbi:HD domain-containing protein [Cystobacter fuscus]|uniref:HD domain-containing protein n=1 Tax=Cystobacter fuscus TaxID=43 RepID=UPI002B2BA294|nr:HD domain-containing protein [Cystobacter fuscus]